MGVSQAIRSRFKEFNRVRPQSQTPMQDLDEPKAKKPKVSGKSPKPTFNHEVCSYAWANLALHVQMYVVYSSCMHGAHLRMLRMYRPYTCTICHCFIADAWRRFCFVQQKCSPPRNPIHEEGPSSRSNQIVNGIDCLETKDEH